MVMKPDRKVRIKGQMFYFAVFSLLGLLTVLENYVIYGGLFLLAIIFLNWIKKFTEAMLILLGICFVIYIAAGSFEKGNMITNLSGNEQDFLIFFENEIKMDGNLLFAYAKLYPSQEKVAVRYRIKTEDEKQSLNKQLFPGTACQASGSLEIPPEARNPHAFDYRKYLNRKQIYWVVDVDRLPAELCIDTSSGIVPALKRFRQKEIYRMEERLSEETAALTAALLFGVRDLFNPEIERSYQKIGVVHLLAISGLHVGLLVGMLYFTCIRLGITKEKTELLMLIFLPLYSVVTGLAPPVLRAAAMLMLLISARRHRWQLTPLDAISMAFMLMAFSQPYLIYDIGFQLSFLVSLSLVISAPKILTEFKSFPRQTAAASIISQLASLPIILSSFYEIPLISVLANLLFVPLFSFIILPLLLVTYIAYSLFGSLPVLYVTLLENLIHLVNRISILLAEVPGSSIIIGKPGTSILILQILMIPIFFILWEKTISKGLKPKSWQYILPILPLLVQIIIPYINPYGKIIFIDVGQGDSILIRMPFNKGNYLIDTGGVMAFEQQGWQKRKEVYDPGRNIVLPLLKSEGISKIDKLILTHGDADHIGGASALFNELRIKQLILPRETERSTLELDIIKKALGQGTAIYSGGAGAGWNSGGGNFNILNPSGNTGDRNERSVVLLANIGGKKWLFTGDLGNEGEQILLKNFGDLDIDVLKVGHHGSKYSSSKEFIESIKPEYAVISVGAKNRYGHPSGEILNRLDLQEVRIFRTDLSGAVIYRFKGDSGTFFTQVP
ncbi:DNA internalization-related competence protein ComEC/Rec2 [Bacillus sp. JJ1609]|uniref:DNA internalization-related competence protein ComEC/Rec2 n=1 Tax=Bacillus sp. JJ1609 TaxID=3122977 RepID=UPI003000C438